MRNFHQNFIFDCNSLGFHQAEHIKRIDDLYLQLANIISAALEQFKKKWIRKDKFKVITGWNRNKHLHSKANKSYSKWISLGRRLHTVDHESMLGTRQEFKTALRNSKMNSQNNL